MLRVKRILCPADFSKPSFHALKVAVMLVQHLGARLYLINVVAPVPAFATSVSPISMGAPAPPISFDIQAYRRQLMKRARKALARTIGQRVPRKLRARVKCVVAYGVAASGILRAARRDRVDLIVIATRGSSRLKRLLFGSTVERVMRAAPCPVLAVRAKSR